MSDSRYNKVTKAQRLAWDAPFKTRLAIAKAFQKQIAKLQREREKLFAKALRTLKVPDTNQAWDYLMNDQVGHSTFEEIIGK